MAASSTTEDASEYKSGTDQDSVTGDYRTAGSSESGFGERRTPEFSTDTTGTSTWDATTDTEVVTPTSNFDTERTTPVGASPGTSRAGSTEGGFDAGAGTGSSLSGSDTSFQPTGNRGLESETVRRSTDEESLDQP